MPASAGNFGEAGQAAKGAGVGMQQPGDLHSGSGSRRSACQPGCGCHEAVDHHSGGPPDQK